MEELDPALLLLDLPNMRGLEIGPLYRPRVRRSQGDVRYVDYYSTAELRHRYSANQQVKPYLDQIVDVDYVIKEDSSLAAAAGPDAPFDYIIASHVIEHVADPIGWLADASVVLGDNGLVSLVVPDRRFSFDVNRSETRPQDWVEWHMRELRAPTYGQIFDFFAHVTTIDGPVDTAGLWAGTADYSGVRRSDVLDADVAGYQRCLEHKETGQYFDVHAGVYSPASVVDLIDVATRLEWMRFEIASIVSTPPNTLEFYVTLRRCDEVDRQLDAVRRARRSLIDAPKPALVNSSEHGQLPPIAGPGEWMIVSSAERRLLQEKRRLIDSVRRLRHR